MVQEVSQTLATHYLLS